MRAGAHARASAPTHTYARTHARTLSRARARAPHTHTHPLLLQANPVVTNLSAPSDAAGMLANFAVNEAAPRRAAAPRVASARPLAEYPVRNLSAAWEPVLSLRRWYHLAGVYRRARIELFVDGARVAWAPLPAGGGAVRPLADAELHIGHDCRSVLAPGRPSARGVCVWGGGGVTGGGPDAKRRLV